MKSHTGIVLALVLVAFGLTMRLVPHMPNFSPLLAIALFAGFLFPRKHALFIPLAIVILSDAVIGFHRLSLLVWVCYVAIALAASYLPKQTSMKRGIGAAILASTAFFLITNFGVWAEGRMYEMTLGGLWQSYVSAIPFFRNSLISDVLYSAAFFGLYAVTVRHGQSSVSANRLPNSRNTYNG